MAQKEKQIKTVYLLRHAKAENQDLKKNDHERRLIDKGIRHAGKMAKLLEDFRFPPEAIFTSSAARAHETAQIFAKALKLENQLTVEDTLYSASQQAYLQRIQKMPEELSSVMIVGHNPSLSDLVGLLTLGEVGKLPVELKKGGIATLSRSAARGPGYRLDWVAPPALLRNLREE